LSNMSYTDDIKSEPSGTPWIIAAVALCCISAAVTYGLTRSLNLAALFAAIIFVCLSLGWWAAGLAPSGEVGRAAQASEIQSAQVNVGDGRPDLTLAAVRFARSAIEATPNPVIIIDPSGRIVTTNHAARTRFSVGEAPTRFHNVVRRPDIIEAVEAVFADRKARSFAMETRVPVDRYERVSIAAFEASGEPYILVTILDETEARMSERMRADFLANASHELRTPLAAIIGFIETLRGPARDDTKARERFLEVMHTQADRMSRLISDLLSLSRIELNEHVAPTQHSDIACAAFEAVDGLTPDKKNRLVMDVASGPVWVLGDRDEMAQVMLNLIDNALKYSDPNTKVKVTVSGGLTREAAIGLAMRQWEDAARLPLTSPELERDRLYGVLRVENEGDGIERQHLPRLSERFFRIEDTASGKSGTGLGLAIVKHIVSRHRGGLVVESELARGAAFAIYLPQPFAEAELVKLSPDAVH
jgi:two-component system, OmpR family, phosphate regulon sensor histidine kinase PhoR